LEKLILENRKGLKGETPGERGIRLRTHGWAATLKRRIFALLNGDGDPLWIKDIKPYSEGRRSLKGRAIRFIEMLKTVDGMFLQGFIAVPEGDWTWEKFDLTVLKNISSLIGDEFLDGNIKEEFHHVTTRYTELKRARKTYKSLSNLGRLEEALADKSQRNSLVPPWLQFLLPMWEYTRSIKDPVHLAYVDSVLCQTRGAGQPPELVKMQSKRKFLKTVSETPVPLTSTEKLTIQAAILTFDERVDQSIFTGLDTKARITLNANACWEKTRQDGGTVEAIAEIVTTGRSGVPAYTRDLSTGKIEDALLLSESNTGTYIFWRCLEEVLKTDPANIRMAALVMISEPGKARTVTKASAALKVVLDVVNKICSHPLGKIPSSTSGMHKSSHAWNTFRKGWTAEGRSYMFAEQSRSTKVRPDGTRIVEKTYRDVWLSSTDYSEATDKLRHEVARPIAEYWMKKCGIPPILQMIVRGTCYAPRPVVFEAHGSMSVYGESWTGDSPFENPRFVTLQQGVLMGDPLTKVCLHLVNILVRTVGEHYNSLAFIRKIFPHEFDPVQKYIKDYCTEKLPPEYSITREEPTERIRSVPSPPQSSPPAHKARETTAESKDVLPSTKKPEVVSRPTPPKLPDAVPKAVPPKPIPKPLGFTLTDRWLTQRPTFEVTSSIGSIDTYRINGPIAPPQKTPSMDRALTLQNVRIKEALSVISQREDSGRRLKETCLQQEAIRQGFTWNPVGQSQVAPIPELQENIPSRHTKNRRPRPMQVEEEISCSIL
jgi:hypothetical protein